LFPRLGWSPFHRIVESAGDDGATLMVPFTHDCVPEIDVSRRIVVALPAEIEVRHE
jgi:ribosomal 30S subunit maturation factor RimM